MSDQYFIQNGFRSDDQANFQNLNPTKSSDSIFSSSSYPRDHKGVIFEEDYAYLASKSLQTGDNKNSFTLNRHPHVESSKPPTNLQFRHPNESSLRFHEAHEFDNKITQYNREESYPSLDNIIKGIDPQALKKETIQSNRSVQSEALSPKIASGNYKKEHASANSNTTKDNSGSYTSITTEPVFKVERKPIIVMKIELGGGRRDEISLYDGDNPAKVALEFCCKNQLESRVLEPLTKNIFFQLGNYQKQKEERMRQISSSRGPPPSNSNFYDSLMLNQSTCRNIIDKDDSDEMMQTISNRYGAESQPSVVFEPKVGGEKPKVRPPAIKFELQNGKPLRNESPQPEKEVRRELFKEGSKKSHEHKSASVHEENQRIDSPLLRKKGIRGGVVSQQESSCNGWEQLNNRTISNLRHINQSTDSLSVQQNSDKMRSLSSKSFDAIRKSKKVNKWIVDVSRSQNFDEKDDKEEDYFEKAETQAIFPSSKGITYKKLHNETIGNRDAFDNIRAKSKSERDRHEDNENSLQPNIERLTEAQKAKPKNFKGQSSANKLKAQLAFVNVTVVSPTNKLKGALSVRNANLSTRNDSINNSRSVRQSAGTFKLKDSFHDSKSSHNTSINFKVREKSRDEADLVINKSISLKPSNNLKENRGAKLGNIQRKQPQNGHEVSRDPAQKVSLREAILNRTRSEKSLHKRKAQELEEKVVRQVFRTLDKHKKGIITAETVDISTIDSKILELISEVLFAMEDEDCSLNADQFHQRLIKKSLIGELMKLVPTPNEDNHTYNMVNRGKEPKPKLTTLQKKSSSRNIHSWKIL